MRCFHLHRIEDETGNSGTGNVAEVVAFDDGTAAVHWSAATNALHVSSTVVYQTLDDVLKVHGHNGKTILVPIE